MAQAVRVRRSPRLMKRAQQLGFNFSSGQRPQPGAGSGRIPTTMEWSRKLTAKDVGVLKGDVPYSEKGPDVDEGFTQADLKDPQKAQAIYKVIQSRLAKRGQDRPRSATWSANAAGGRPRRFSNSLATCGRRRLHHEVPQDFPPRRDECGGPGAGAGPLRRRGRFVGVRGAVARVAAVTLRGRAFQPDRLRFPRSAKQGIAPKRGHTLSGWKARPTGRRRVVGHCAHWRFTHAILVTLRRPARPRRRRLRRHSCKACCYFSAKNAEHPATGRRRRI